MGVDFLRRSNRGQKNAVLPAACHFCTLVQHVVLDLITERAMAAFGQKGQCADI